MSLNLILLVSDANHVSSSGETTSVATPSTLSFLSGLLLWYQSFALNLLQYCWEISDSSSISHDFFQASHLSLLMSLFLKITRCKNKCIFYFITFFLLYNNTIISVWQHKRLASNLIFLFSLFVSLVVEYLL